MQKLALVFDPFFADTINKNMWGIMLREAYVDRANAHLESKAESDPIPEEHYLLDLSTQELAEILAQIQDWSPQDVA